jgi:asparagine synthetase B (glutamine-hydrolysing)
MIKELLETQIREQIPTKKCAVLLSGGVDSLSVALAAHNVGKEVIAYSFHLEEFVHNKFSTNILLEDESGGITTEYRLYGKESYDFKTAQKVSEQMGWTFKPTIVPTNNLEEDWHTLVKMDCKKKTHFECVFPFLYVYPNITEEYVLTGWGADGYFGVSKKAQMRYGSEKGYKKYEEYFEKNPQNIKTFDEARDIYFLPENSAGLKWHNKVVELYNKKHITPYLHPKVKKYFYEFDWEQLNKPEQKHHIRDAFPEFLEFGKIRKHTNLHLGGGVDKLFESLLNNSKINFNDRTRMMDVSKDWYKKEFKI